MATLIVVMTLFFIMSLVAAYASRNLIFEQRTSANQYRSTQAFEAAESGVEWALGLLNAGRVDAACVPTNDPAFDTFRQRYLNANADTGNYEHRTWVNGLGVSADLRPSCVRDGANWACSCPSAGDPVLAAPAGDAAAPAFRVSLTGGGRPGMLSVLAVGCTSLNEDCMARQRTVAGDAVASVTAASALAPALPTAPPAAVTVRGTLTIAAGFAWHVANADAATNGITINTGGVFSAPAAVLDTVAGSPGAGSIVDSDAALAGLSADRMFVTFFGTNRATFKRQATVVQYECSGGCSDGLREIVDRNPGRPIWVKGDLTLDSDTVLGSANVPVLLVVEGNLALTTAGVRVNGIVYSQAADAVVSGLGIVQGALIAEGNVAGATAPSVLYDAPIVNRLRQTYGSIIRVPGGWKDN